MTRQRLILVGLAGLLVAGSGSATDVRGTLKTSEGHVIPVREVGTWIWRGGPDETAAAQAFAVVLRPLSRTTGYEYCAQLCRQPDQWGAVIVTLESGRYCPRVALCPDSTGWVGGPYIHSHRPVGSYRMTPADRALQPGATAAEPEVIDLDTDRPSDEDLRLGGWVVGPSTLWRVVAGEAQPVAPGPLNLNPRPTGQDAPKERAQRSP